MRCDIRRTWSFLHGYFFKKRVSELKILWNLHCHVKGYTTSLWGFCHLDLNLNYWHSWQTLWVVDHTKHAYVQNIFGCQLQTTPGRESNQWYSGADPRGGQHCLGHGQISGRAKQLCLLVLLLVFGCGPTSGDMVRFVGWICPWYWHTCISIPDKIRLRAVSFCSTELVERSRKHKNRAAKQKLAVYYWGIQL